ncbi:MAG: 4-hydroxybenzoyl-CoA thioesterase [Marinilabiliales bacterium]|nr:MAG: 4-hydroxybenzoyl-CoA thioesterase [Marinilabiliales bacterium]
MTRRKKIVQEIDLIDECELNVRFSEVDSMQIVWHGNYVKYLEDGRESFGKKYGIGYMDVYRAGLLTPIVGVNLNYKKPLKYEDKAIIRTRYIDSPAAIIQFEYEIVKLPDKVVTLSATTTQAFIDTTGELILTLPAFFEKWKKKWGFIK